MIGLNKTQRNCESDLIQDTRTNLKIRLVDPEGATHPTRMNDFRGEDRLLDCDQENGFFKGLFFVLPGSILLWIIVIWVIRSLMH